MTFAGAFQYDCRDPELNGESNDKNGAESVAVSTYTTQSIVKNQEKNEEKNLNHDKKKTT